MATEPKTLFGHPRGLYVLFFTELWERFSFYGMKTLLLLYLVNHLFWSQGDASSLLGTYAMLAYGLPVFGGFVADRWLGAKRTVVIGAILLSIGHFLMAFEAMWIFYSALGFIIAGVGLLKPNVSTQVGNLYRPGDPRRDGAFTIFYMGINLGALIGPLLCDWLRVHYGYDWGFAAAGVGMVFGLIVYVIGQRKLVEFRQDVPEEETETAAGEAASPQRETHPRHVVRDRIIVLLIVFAFVILFWTAFEQSPNAMLRWADKHTNLRLLSTQPPPATLSFSEETESGTTTAPTESWLTRFEEGWHAWWQNPQMTSGQTQSFNPFFIIALAPVFAFLWMWLDKRGLQPSTPTKMVLGLVFAGVAFLVMWPAAHLENRRCTAPLNPMPPNVDLSKYGATRLHYDAASKQLVMHGVLSDLDRLRVLADSAPVDVHDAVDSLVKQSEEQTGEGWKVSVKLESAPPDFKIVGEQAESAVQWDAASHTLTATKEISLRAKSEILAAAADPAFKTAIDKIYLQSSQFRVSVWWLVLFFMFLTMGELCLSPVGLSLVTKLAPPKHVGLFMGGWFLATAIAEKLAQVFGGMWGSMTPLKYFMIFVLMCGVGAFVMAILIRPMKRMMHGVQ